MGQSTCGLGIATVWEDMDQPSTKGNKNSYILQQQKMSSCRFLSRRCGLEKVQYTYKVYLRKEAVTWREIQNRA